MRGRMPVNPEHADTASSEVVRGGGAHRAESGDYDIGGRQVDS